MNNLYNIEKALSEKKGSVVIISDINESVTVFYKILIQKISAFNGIKTRYIEDVNSSSYRSNDLFLDKQAFVTGQSSLKELDIILSNKSSTNVLFVFAPYRIFKKYSSTLLSINSYDYKKDMPQYLKKFHRDIKDLGFTNNFVTNPNIFFSEVEKKMINYSDEKLNEEKKDSLIPDVRREAYKLKNDFLLKQVPLLYKLIKKESLIKKFNFLSF